MSSIIDIYVYESVVNRELITQYGRESSECCLRKSNCV